MAIPTITSITPTKGHTGGKQLVEIIGTNFRLPNVVPNPSGVTPAPPPTMAIQIGGVPCTNIQVVSATRVYAHTGVRDEGSNLSVTVTNIDDNGAPIAGESATLANAYNYRLSQLTDDSALLRLCLELVRSFRQQIHPSVHYIMVHTDYDDTPLDAKSIAKLAKTPSLNFIGPSMTENRFYSLNQRARIVDTVDNTIGFKRRVFHTVDAVFDIVGVTNTKREILNLANLVAAYFRKNTLIKHPLSQEDLEIEFDGGGEPNIVTRSNNDNVHLFTGSFIVRGFDIGEFPGFERDQLYDADRQLSDGDEFLELQPVENLTPDEGSFPTVSVLRPIPLPSWPNFPFTKDLGDLC